VDPQGKNLPGFSRDPQRTPMQWEASEGTGFTTAAPWLPLASDYEWVNVEAEKRDPASMLSLYRRLIALRGSEPALHIGSYAPIPAEGDVFAFLRKAGGKRFLVALNMGHAPARLERLELRGEVVLGTHPEREGDGMAGELVLEGDEGVVVALE
jgi:alpha-glucosidase